MVFYNKYPDENAYSVVPPRQCDARFFQGISKSTHGKYRSSGKGAEHGDNGISPRKTHLTLRAALVSSFCFPVPVEHLERKATG